MVGMKYKVGDIFTARNTNTGKRIVAVIESVGVDHYNGKSTSDGGQRWWKWTNEKEFDGDWMQLEPKGFDIWVDYVAHRLAA